MARKCGGRGPNQLTALELLSKAKKPGLHTDGGGLYLRVGKEGRQRSWLAIYHLHDRRREMGLGSLDSVSLARAREKAAEVRALVADGIDPIEGRRAKRAIPTFGDLADEWIKKKSANVRGKKSIPRYNRALGENGYAENLRAKRIDTITGEDVLAVLRPIWIDRLTTAKTLRTYLFDVFDIAKARKHRAGDNPAAWEGLLKAELELDGPTKRTKKHHAAMPWRDVPSFVARLRQSRALPAIALEYLILNVNRTTEVLEMKVAECELGKKPKWTIPGARMKAGRPHEIWLSKRAVEILKKQIPAEARSNEFAFGGAKALSNMAMAMLMRRMGIEDATVHGFRSSFRDWVNDATEHPRELAEMALAHSVGDATEQAYLRGNAPERRAKLMQDWADFIDGKLKPIGHEQVEDKPAEAAAPAVPAKPRRRRVAPINPYQATLDISPAG